MYSKHVLKDARLSIVVTIVAAALSSFSLSLIPFTSGFEEGESNVIAYVIAAVFWIGLLLTFIAAHSTKRTLYRFREKLIIKGYITKHQPIGIISFSKDWRMWILYGITLLGLVLIITDIIIGYVPEKVMFPTISVTILSFAVHCVFDGKYYKAYKLIKESVNNETNR